MQIEQIWKELVDGTFDLTLPFCHLVQRLPSNPVIHQGAGFVALDDQGRLHMRVFSPISLDQAARNHRQKMLHLTPAPLPADAFGFNITAKDIHDAEWSSKWQTIEERSGAGTEVRIDLTEIAKVDPCIDPIQHRQKRWLVPGNFTLPGGRSAPAGESGYGAEFSGECDGANWRIAHIHGGIDIRFWVEDGPLEPRDTYFLWAMEILLGRALTPFITHYAHAGTLITLIKSRNTALEAKNLIKPIYFRDWIPASAATEFLCCFIRMREDEEAEITPLGVIYRFWHRMLRADENDVENSALIVSVAIEGVIKAHFQSERDVDQELTRLIDASMPIIKSIDVHERVRGILVNSLDNAVRFRMKDTLDRLAKQGAITKQHIDAWKYLRNSGAHGTVPRSGDESLQSHLDKYRCCLDLFYRLIFLAVGYQGLFRDRSCAPWQTTRFLTNDANKSSL